MMEGAVVRDAAGRPARLLGVTRDITAGKHAEAKLQESERALRDLLGALPAAIYVTDATGRITYCNEAAVNLWGAKFGANRLVTLGFAIVIGLAFYLFITRTRMGKAIRASAQDAATAGLMGVNIDMVLGLCFALGAAMAGMAGVLISMYYPIQVVMGQEYTIIAMIVVVLGGLGSIPGSFIGGFLLGLVGSVVTYLDPGLALVAYYFIFILLLLVKPTGIMGR